jgi:hypothetical protein
MLLGAEAANIGFQLAAAGTLRAVSTRTPIRGGDAYTLSTTIGEYLIIRRRSSRLPQDEQATRCEELPLAASSYVLLPPQMASLWRALSRLEFTWPIRTGGDTTNVQLAFVADSPSRDPVATGSCHASRCSISLADGTVLRQHSERSR